MNRKILHVDLDAFFASVEQRDDPTLLNKPVIVGGGEERGVVCTCSYEARKYGVCSAMPGFLAKKKCPKGIFVPVRMKRYKQVSNQVFEVFYEITPLVEPLSIDEAYLDITHLKKDPLKVAYDLKKEILKRTGLTLSIGISYNKFLAKIASDWNKPNGIKRITKEMIPNVLKPLPVRKVYGIGKKSAQKLQTIGIVTVEDLLKLPKKYLINVFGISGMQVYDRIRGIDSRQVVAHRERKSIGRETTFKKDTQNIKDLEKYLYGFSKELSTYLLKEACVAQTLTIKIKTCDFYNHTKSKTYKKAMCTHEQIYKNALEVLKKISLNEKIRLIGLSVSHFSNRNMEQLSFLDEI